MVEAILGEAEKNRGQTAPIRWIRIRPGSERAVWYGRLLDFSVF